MENLQILNAISIFNNILIPKLTVPQDLATSFWVVTALILFPFLTIFGSIQTTKLFPNNVTIVPIKHFSGQIKSREQFLILIACG